MFKKAKGREAGKVASCIAVSSKKVSIMVKELKQYVMALNTQANGERV